MSSAPDQRSAGQPTAERQRLFAPPSWLRDAGRAAWLALGLVLALLGLLGLLALTSSIVLPVITACLLAAVAGPLVAWLQRRGVPRQVGAGLVVLALVAIGVGLCILVLAGVTSQSDAIAARLHDATDRLAQGLQDAGVDRASARDALADNAVSTSSAGRVLLDGLLAGLSGLASLAVFASFAILSLFFLLADGPSIRGWLERHAGVPAAAAHVVAGDLLDALRGYFSGMTIVAGLSAIVVGAGALLLGVPLAGTIAVITFLGSFIPYLGPWVAGTFAVLIALGGQGPASAAAMAIVALVATGPLQQIAQPIAFGATLGLHPLAVLILTIGAGSLFGLAGLVLAAPVAAAVMRIGADLRRASGQAAGRPGVAVPPRPG
jgi:putative heme transporter